MFGLDWVQGGAIRGFLSLLTVCMQMRWGPPVFSVPHSPEQHTLLPVTLPDSLIPGGALSKAGLFVPKK